MIHGLIEKVNVISNDNSSAAGLNHTSTHRASCGCGHLINASCFVYKMSKKNCEKMVFKLANPYIQEVGAGKYLTFLIFN